MKSPAFSSFRKLMDQWDDFCEIQTRIKDINLLLDSKEFVFYFQKDNSIYGAPEESRIVFAKMKNPDNDMVGDWKDEVSFLAVNIDDIIKGEGTQRVFCLKDIKGIKILDKKEVVDKLKDKK